MPPNQGQISAQLDPVAPLDVLGACGSEEVGAATAEGCHRCHRQHQRPPTHRREIPACRAKGLSPASPCCSRSSDLAKSSPAQWKSMEKLRGGATCQVGALRCERVRLHAWHGRRWPGPSVNGCSPAGSTCHLLSQAHLSAHKSRSHSQVTLGAFHSQSSASPACQPVGLGCLVRPPLCRLPRRGLPLHGSARDLRPVEMDCGWQARPFRTRVRSLGAAGHTGVVIEDTTGGGSEG